MEFTCKLASSLKRRAGFYKGFEVQTAEGLEGSGCPQSMRGEQESSDIPSLVRETIELIGMCTLLYPIIVIQGSGLRTHEEFV
eukprot:1159476-Pelagomonas_calceolata.AAC.7